MNAKMIMLAVAVAVIGAAALMMCDDSDAAAGDVLKSGDCGTSLTYEVRSLNADDSQVEVVISGSGEMYRNTSASEWPWYTYISKVVSVTVTGADNIGRDAFQGYTNLKNITLNEGLTSIWFEAFGECSSLTNIELPDTLTTISNMAFYKTALTNLVIPNTVNSIGMDAFTQTPIIALTTPAISTTSNMGFNHLESITYTTSMDWDANTYSYTPQFTSKSTLQSITFADDRIPAYALYGQNLDTLTITNASGPDVLGIYTAPNTKATASALTVNGTAAQIVRLTDVAGNAELVDSGITANDVNVHWDTSPDGYATGEVDASPELLVYPAGYHSREPNNFGVWMTTISILLVVGLLMALILPMIARRLE